MGCYETVWIPCPKCGERYPAQSKSGPCEMGEYQLGDCPQDVLHDVNRHAPYTCERCGEVFAVDLQLRPVVVKYNGPKFDPYTREWNP